MPRLNLSLRLALPAIVALALSPAVIAQAKKSPVAKASAAQPQQLPEVQQLLSRGQLKEAEAKLITLAAQQPEPAGTERLLGTIHYQRNEFAAADTAFEHAITQDRSDLEAVQMRGVTLYRMGRAAEAIPLLERSNTSIAASNADGTYVLAVCYMDVHRYDDARRIFAKQYKLPPDSGGAYLFLARMLLRRNYPADAAQMAEKALAINPNLPLVHLLLGQIALTKLDQNQAVTQFEAERKINPMLGEVYERLGDAYMRASRLEEAQQALDCAVVLEPNATGPYILLGQVLLKRQDPGTALNYLARAEKMDPRNHLTHLLLGQAYRAAGRKEDATREYKAAESIQTSGGDDN